MPTNVYFDTGTTSEQRLYEDLIIEQLKIYGQDVYYLPRKIANKDTIFGEDPDFNKVKIEAFGGPFEFISSPATFSPNPPQFKDSPSIMLFEWQTNCSHVRERPYDIQFIVRCSFI